MGQGQTKRLMEWIEDRKTYFWSPDRKVKCQYFQWRNDVLINKYSWTNWIFNMFKNEL